MVSNIRSGGFSSPSVESTSSTESSSGRTQTQNQSPARVPGYSTNDTFDWNRAGPIVSGKSGTINDPPPTGSGSTGGGEHGEGIRRTTVD